MKRFNERKEEYFNALERLKEALEREVDDVVKKYFITFIWWKNVKRYLWKNKKWIC